MNAAESDRERVQAAVHALASTRPPHERGGKLLSFGSARLLATLQRGRRMNAAESACTPPGSMPNGPGFNEAAA